MAKPPRPEPPYPSTEDIFSTERVRLIAEEVGIPYDSRLVLDLNDSANIYRIEKRNLRFGTTAKEKSAPQIHTREEQRTILRSLYKKSSTLLSTLNAMGADEDTRLFFAHDTLTGKPIRDLFERLTSDLTTLRDISETALPDVPKGTRGVNPLPYNGAVFRLASYWKAALGEWPKVDKNFLRFFHLFLEKVDPSRASKFCFDSDGTDAKKIREVLIALKNNSRK